jgi:hypothetical protein
MLSKNPRGADLFDGDGNCIELKWSNLSVTYDKRTKKRNEKCNFSFHIPTKQDIISNIVNKTKGGGAQLVVGDDNGEVIKDYHLCTEFLVRYVTMNATRNKNAKTINFGCDMCRTCKSFHRLDRFQYFSALIEHGMGNQVDWRQVFECVSAQKCPDTTKRIAIPDSTKSPLKIELVTENVSTTFTDQSTPQAIFVAPQPMQTAGTTAAAAFRAPSTSADDCSMGVRQGLQDVRIELFPPQTVLHTNCPPVSFSNENLVKLKNCLLKIKTKNWITLNADYSGRNYDRDFEKLGNGCRNPENRWLLLWSKIRIDLELLRFVIAHFSA